MKIGILGYGRMGHEIEKVAAYSGHSVAAIFDIDKPFEKTSDIKGSQVLIDFTLAEGVIDNLITAAFLDVPIVEGTTGWLDDFDKVKQIKNLTMIYSPNFSIGVYQFTKIVEYAAKLMGTLDSYDCYLHEWHHTGKADSPSGTAKKLSDILLNNLQYKDKTLFDTSHGVIDKKALHVTSTRVGSVPGTHEIGFESVYDNILLKHQARGREGLALGAVKAAEWLMGKKGIFTMDDFMNDLNRTSN